MLILGLEEGLVTLDALSSIYMHVCFLLAISILPLGKRECLFDPLRGWPLSSQSLTSGSRDYRPLGNWVTVGNSF